MDFLRDCTSSCQTLSGWSTFSYFCYIIDENSNAASNTSNRDVEFLLKDTALDLEHALLQKRFIARADLTRNVVWIFEPITGEGHFAKGHKGLKIVDGCDGDVVIKAGRDGTFQSSDIAGPNFSNRITTTQAGSSTLDSSSVDWKPTLVELYSSFTLAIERTISYRLSQQGDIIPIDSSTFVIASITSPQSFPVETSLDVFHISSYLTSSGVLTFSIYSNDQTTSSDLKIYRISTNIDSGTPVLLVPGLLFATYVGTSQIQFDTEFAIQWRRNIATWLHKQGLNPRDLDDTENWILVKNMSQRLRSGRYIPKEIAFLWPRTLSLTVRSLGNPTSNSVTVEGSTNFPWINNEDTQAPMNPLSFAEKWSSGGAEREQRLIRRKKQETVNLIKSNPFPPSPINVRSIVYGDVHGPAGVYPTPPDGLSSQVGTGAMSVGTPVGMNDVPAQVFDIKHTPIGRRPSKPETQRMQLGALMNLEDDLFGDMEEDDFAGNDITDADFSFFDQDENGASFSKFNNRSGKVLPTEGPKNIEQIDQADSTLVPQIDNTDTTNPQAKTTTTDTTEDIEMVDAVVGSSVQSIDQRQKANKYLTPAEVQRRLFSRQMADAAKEKAKHQSQIHSQYQPVMFNASLTNSDAKYSSSGAFSFSPSKPLSDPISKAPNSQAQTPLYTPFLRPNLKAHPLPDSDTTDSESSSDDEISNDLYDKENFVSRSNSVTRSDGPEVDANTLSPQHKDRLQLNQGDLARLYMQLVNERINVTSQDLKASLLQFSSMKTESVTLTKKPKRSDPAFIFVAQLVVDQIAMSTFDSYSENGPVHARALMGRPHVFNQNTIMKIQSMVKTALGVAEIKGLIKYCLMPDYSASDQSNTSRNSSRPQLPKTPVTNTKPDISISGHPMRLNPPSVRLRKNEAVWDMVPTAISFWDTLGLAPTGGSKNLVAYTICPSNDDVIEMTKGYMKELGMTYESFKLGKHDTGNETKNDTGEDKKSDTEEDTDGDLIDDRILPWDIGDSNTPETDIGSSLVKICIELASMLLSYKKSNQTTGSAGKNANYSFIVYIVNPFPGVSPYLATIASSFWQLFTKYKQGTKPSASEPIHEVQLQIIPISAIIRSGQLVLGQSTEIQSLAKEVYNRFPPVSIDDTAALPIATGWSVQLAEALPRKINFELKSQAPSNIMFENSQLHVGYAISSSGNWISAAFTDNSGKYQCHTSYCMAGGRNFSEAATEIWQTCVDIMKVRNVNWRLCIAKVGEMDMNELEAWANMASQQQSFSLITVVFSIEISPPISIIPHLSAPLSPQGPVKPGLTPVGTPRPGVSPDPGSLTPAATPSEITVNEAVNDADAHLVDTTDDTWAIILAHRLNLRSGPRQHRQSLASGLLIKVPPSTSAQNPSNHEEVLDQSRVPCIAVHLLWGRNQGKLPDHQDKAWNHPATVSKGLADSLLREFLVLFRNLALLAKVRDIKDWMGGLIPWHVLVASKAVDGLDAVYGMEKW